MQHFDVAASSTFLLLTELSYNYYLISDEEYLERLFILKELSDPTHADTIQNIDLYINELNDFFAIESDERPLYSDDVLFEENFNTSSNDKNIHETFQGNDFDPKIHFITSSSGIISKWEFHKFDRDFFPTIPHGHAIINNKIKLDAYRGYIYKNNKPHTREARQFIIDLWNDKKFRDMARETISYYLKTYPQYQGWTIKNPLILPRRRKH